MDNRNERLRAFDVFSGQETRGVAPEAPLDQARARELRERRTKTLDGIRGKITPELYKTIRAKVEYEHSCLLGLIESKASLAETKKRLNKVLKAEYFIRKPLDADIF